MVSFSTNRNNAYALDLTIFDLQYQPPQVITSRNSAVGLGRARKTSWSDQSLQVKLLENRHGIFRNFPKILSLYYSNAGDPHQECLSQSFTAFTLLLEAVSQRIQGTVMCFCRNYCRMIMENENWEQRVSPKYDFPFLFQFFLCRSNISKVAEQSGMLNKHNIDWS